MGQEGNPMARKVGQIIGRGARRWLMRVISAAITKPNSGNTTIEQARARFGKRKPA